MGSNKRWIEPDWNAPPPPPAPSTALVPVRREASLLPAGLTEALNKEVFGLPAWKVALGGLGAALLGWGIYRAVRT